MEASKKPSVDREVVNDAEPGVVGEGAKSAEPSSRTEKAGRGKWRAGVVTLVIGVVVLIAGLAFMLIQLTQGARLRDAEYLVEVGTWVREDAPGVVWEFTEVGKGRLTTNDGLNQYDFIWALEGDELLVETDWLYTLNDTYQYQLDQGSGRLILGGEIVFEARGQE